MFKNIIILIITLMILCGAILILFTNNLSNELINPNQKDRDVQYISGCHHKVWKENNYICYYEDVTLENTTNYDLWGYLIADASRENQYIDEEFIYAYDRETDEKLLVFIPANSQIKLSNVYLKAKSSSDSEALRTNRNPLYDVIFEEIKMEEPKD